jgi:hypothetical protein
VTATQRLAVSEGQAERKNRKQTGFFINGIDGGESDVNEREREREIGSER